MCSPLASGHYGLVNRPAQEISQADLTSRDLGSATMDVPPAVRVVASSNAKPELSPGKQVRASLGARRVPIVIALRDRGTALSGRANHAFFGQRCCARYQSTPLRSHP